MTRWHPASRAALRFRANDLYETPACATRALILTGLIPPERLACLPEAAL
jgi:hypothetical protein